MWIRPTPQDLPDEHYMSHSVSLSDEIQALLPYWSKTELLVEQDCSPLIVGCWHHLTRLRHVRLSKCGLGIDVWPSVQIHVDVAIFLHFLFLSRVYPAVSRSVVEAHWNTYVTRVLYGDVMVSLHWRYRNAHALVDAGHLTCLWNFGITLASLLMYNTAEISCYSIFE